MGKSHIYSYVIKKSEKKSRKCLSVQNNAVLLHSQLSAGAIIQNEWATIADKRNVRLGPFVYRLGREIFIL